MRKILLGTTAVAGAALMSMNVAQAQTAPTVRIGGYFDFTASYVSDDADKSLLPGQAGVGKVAFRSDTEIHVIVAGKAANGLAYGATVEMQVDALGAGSTGFNTDEMWAFMSTPTMGTLQFGDQDSAANQLNVGAPYVTATGPSAIWDDVASNNQYLNSTINDGNDSTKLIYLSPQFFGFDFGVSYAPSTGEGESQYAGGTTGSSSAALQRNRANSSIRNEISGGLRYRGSFGNVGVAAGIAAMTGDAAVTTANLQDPTAYQVGASVSAYGFTVGGHYLWGKYAAGSFGRTGILRGRDNTDSLNFGVTYTTGPISLGGYWSRGTADNGPGLSEREQTVFGVGATYSIASGLEVYTSYTNVTDKNSPLQATIGTRDADIFVIGTRLAF